MLVQNHLTLVANPEQARPVTVLVADDSAALRALVRITLTSQGWHIVEAETADTARELARRQVPDLVLLDITFGDEGPDGLAVCAELKADPATANIPIVILTAHDDAAERERASAARADAYVVKPFGPLDLMHVMRDLLPGPGTPALGVLLLDAGAVQPATLERALEEQRELGERGTPKRIGDVLLERGLVSPPALDRALVEQARERMRAQSGATRVLVVDDHLAVREGLKSLIAALPEMEVVGEAVTADEALRLARRHRPDVIVLDNEMPGRNGVDIVPDLRAQVPSAKIVMFSLEGTMRERAIAAGAHTFLLKDAPIEHIVSAIRPGPHRVDEPRPARAYVPASSARQSSRRAMLVGILAFAAYVAAFFALESAFGASAGVFVVVPVVVIAALLGSGAGMIAGALALLLNFALWSVSGHTLGEPVLDIGTGGAGLILLLLVGFSVGAIRDLELRLDPRRARVQALTEAARSLGGLERGDVVGAVLEAMLRIVPGEVSLLFANAAGEPQFIAASRPLPGEAVDRLASLVRGPLRDGTPRIGLELGPAERPTDRSISAVLLPVATGGQDVRGVLVLAAARSLTDQDANGMRAFADYLWVVLRNAPRPAPALAKHAARHRTG